MLLHLVDCRRFAERIIWQWQPNWFGTSITLHTHTCRTHSATKMIIDGNFANATKNGKTRSVRNGCTRSRMVFVARSISISILAKAPREHTQCVLYAADTQSELNCIILCAAHAPCPFKCTRNEINFPSKSLAGSVFTMCHA